VVLGVHAADNQRNLTAVQRFLRHYVTQLTGDADAHEVGVDRLYIDFCAWLDALTPPPTARSFAAELTAEPLAGLAVVRRDAACPQVVMQPRTLVDAMTQRRWFLVHVGPATASRSELKFREAAEAACGVVFTTERPVWLTHDKGAALELDMFNAALGVAIEYDGPQHHSYPNAYHATRSDFDRQLERDAWKTGRCAAHGVKLIRIRCTQLPDELEQLASAWKAFELPWGGVRQWTATVGTS
jgi:hypothetical protein